MTVPSLEELRAVWTARATDTLVGGARPWYRTLLDLLADGIPVEVERLAAATGLPPAEIQERFEQARGVGYEFDAEGRLVGAALTLQSTQHRFRVRGHDLYAWCGFDTLFLPILLQEPAHVGTTCPVTGLPLALDVAADGSVTNASPTSLVLAIVGPEVVACCVTTGPTSEVCTQMPFFAHRAAGERWLADHPGVALVTLDEAVELARAYAATT